MCQYCATGSDILIFYGVARKCRVHIFTLTQNWAISDSNINPKDWELCLYSFAICLWNSCSCGCNKQINPEFCHLSKFCKYFYWRIPSFMLCWPSLFLVTERWTRRMQNIDPLVTLNKTVGEFYPINFWNCSNIFCFHLFYVSRRADFIAIVYIFWTYWIGRISWMSNSSVELYGERPEYKNVSREMFSAGIFSPPRNQLRKAETGLFSFFLRRECDLRTTPCQPHHSRHTNATRPHRMPSQASESMKP